MSIKTRLDKINAEWLLYLRERDAVFNALFTRYADDIIKVIDKYTVNGVIISAGLLPIGREVKKAIRAMRPEIKALVLSSMAKSADFGFRSHTYSLIGSTGRRSPFLGSSYLNSSGVVMRYSGQPFTESFWYKLRTKTLAKIEASRQSGFSLSERIWDFTRSAERAILSTVNQGIVNGDSSRAIAKAVQGFLNNPNSTNDLTFSYKPGRGVYRNAYQNALRLSRTKSATAYSEATKAYANSKSWIKGYIWHTASGEPCPICVDLEGDFFPKSDPPDLPAHPQCYCYLELVIDG